MLHTMEQGLIYNTSYEQYVLAPGVILNSDVLYI